MSAERQLLAMLCDLVDRALYVAAAVAAGGSTLPPPAADSVPPPYGEPMPDVRPLLEDPLSPNREQVPFHHQRGAP